MNTSNEKTSVARRLLQVFLGSICLIIAIFWVYAFFFASKQGINVLVYAEGTTGTNKASDRFKPGTFAIATELEALGYIERVADAADARQIVLQFTKAGRALIADSVDSVNQLVAEFTEAIGDGELEHLKHTVAKIYRLQHLEEDIFGNAPGNDIQAMAQQLSMQLGEQGAINLGRLLLAGNSGH